MLVADAFVPAGVPGTAPGPMLTVTERDASNKKAALIARRSATSIYPRRSKKFIRKTRESPEILDKYRILADNFKTTMALALYRKYRPRKLSDLLGQETNVEILKNAAGKGALGHAYLFYGSRGTGKTTTARLIAKPANCERRRTGEKFRTAGEPWHAWGA